MSQKKEKIIVILGPTSSGKTELGVKLADKFNGEIISADSRQVYRRMDIGTGKDLKEYKIKKKNGYKRIKYHLIDVVDPKTEFNLAKYQKLAFKAISDILERKKTPIIVGGTGLYLQAVVDNFILSEVKPNKILREKLEKKSSSQLFLILKKINKNFAENLNHSEINNKRRLIRYIERNSAKNEEKSNNFLSENYKYEFLLLGLNCSKEILRKRIYDRLDKGLQKENMAKEVEDLHKKNKVSWKRLESFGLEYKYVSLFLRKKINYEDMFEKLNIAIRQFSKRQMSWFRRWEREGKKIYWIKDEKDAQKKVKNFIS